MKILKKAVIAMAASTACVSTVNAGFMDDFYSQAGAAANVTPAQTFKTQSGSFVTGGSVVWRVPQKNFTPFSIQAPSIKAGCGGIDFFAGSFGFANSTEFVNYLRNIGQNAVGLFFQLALESMSPQLMKTIKQISDDIQRMNNFLGNSCQMAKGLVAATQKSSWMENEKTKAAGTEVATAASSDFYSSWNRVKSSVGDMFSSLDANQPGSEASNSGGSPGGKPQKNVLWIVLGSGELAGMDEDYRDVVMSLIGSKIYKQKAGDAERPEIESMEAMLTVKNLAGRFSDSAVSLRVWSCGSDLTSSCLDRTTRTINNYKPLARKAYESMQIVRDAIVGRTDIITATGGVEAMQMLGATRLPAFRILELTSTPGMLGVSEALMQRYADLIGIELASSFIETLAHDVLKSVSGGTRQDGLLEADIQEMRYRIEDLRKQAADHRAEVQRIAGSQSELIDQLTHLERSIMAGFNMKMAQNLKFAQAGRS